MPRKKNQDDWKPDDRGRYRRMVGWKEVDGKRVQQPFYFGNDKDQAKSRYLHVKGLWSYLVQKNQEPSDTFGFPSTREQEYREYVWTEESLCVARELAAGKVQIVVDRSHHELPEAYCFRLQRLAKKYPMVYFVPDDQNTYSEGKAFWKQAADIQLKLIQQIEPNVLPESTEFFHAALDKYIEYLKQRDLAPTPNGPQLTPFGVLKVEQTKRIKVRQKDSPLATIDFQGCQDLIDYWRLRPQKKSHNGKPSNPMAKKTCENHIAELMRFFRWLHKSKDYTWRKPEDFDDLETKVKDIEEERTSIAFLQVKVYTIDQLAILNKYATPLERFLLLIGLNCGFKGAEAGTLRPEHIILDKPHPNADTLKEVSKFDYNPDDKFVLYSRNKTKVYGEFLLWRQTAAGLKWAIERHNSICSKLNISVPNLLITEKGQPFFRRTKGNKNQSQIFSNKWAGLVRRIRKDHLDFPSYSFSTLRDTATNLVRHASDGELASIFLCHGKPVKQDDLLDLYTNRPFGKLFKVLQQLEQDLKPVFDAAPDSPWEQGMQQYMSLGKREKIIELGRQGKKVTEIVKQTGVSRSTIHRLLNRMENLTNH